MCIRDLLRSMRTGLKTTIKLQFKNKMHASQFCLNVQCTLCVFEAHGAYHPEHFGLRDLSHLSRLSLKMKISHKVQRTMTVYAVIAEPRLSRYMLRSAKTMSKL
jgi:hypothetical protein